MFLSMLYFVAMKRIDHNLRHLRSFPNMTPIKIPGEIFQIFWLAVAKFCLVRWLSSHKHQSKMFFGEAVGKCEVIIPLRNGCNSLMLKTAILEDGAKKAASLCVQSARMPKGVYACRLTNEASQADLGFTFEAADFPVKMWARGEDGVCIHVTGLFHNNQALQSTPATAAVPAGKEKSNDEPTDSKKKRKNTVEKQPEVVETVPEVQEQQKQGRTKKSKKSKLGSDEASTAVSQPPSTPLVQQKAAPVAAASSSSSTLSPKKASLMITPASSSSDADIVLTSADNGVRVKKPKSKMIRSNVFVTDHVLGKGTDSLSLLFFCCCPFVLLLSIR